MAENKDKQTRPPPESCPFVQEPTEKGIEILCSPPLFTCILLFTKMKFGWELGGLGGLLTMILAIHFSVNAKPEYC